MRTHCHDCGALLALPGPNKTRCLSCREQAEFVKRRAYAAVHREIRQGKLPNLAKQIVACVDCGQRADSYDHRNYDTPTVVEPVCNQCNLKRGPAIRTIARAA